MTKHQQIMFATAKSAFVGGWTPASLTGLIGWWDAQVTASITLSSTTVTRLADQSGVGNHLGDGTTGFKPTYNAAGLNSRPSIMYAGSQYLQSTSTFNLGTGNTLTVFAVAFLTSSSGGYGRLLSYRASGQSHDYDNTGSFAADRNSGNAEICFTRSGVNTAVTSLSYNTPYRMIWTLDSSGVPKVYLNGVPTTGATLSGNWVSGGSLSLGVSNGDTFWWAGAIAEAGIATGYHDATAVATLDAYLQTKWGL